MSETSVVNLHEVEFAYPGAASFYFPRFELRSGEKVLIQGLSGSGKSTLLNLLGGFLQPSAGVLEVLGEDLRAMFPSQKDRFRADHLGFIFQTLNLIAYLTVAENALLPLQFSPLKKKRVGPNPLAVMEEHLRGLGLEAEVLSQKANKLSLGQSQRVAAARALIGDPELLLCDEPTSSLDWEHRQGFIRQLWAQLERTGASLVMVSHDESLAPFFDRVLPFESLCKRGRQ